MSRDIVPTCPEIRHGWAGRIPVAGYGPTRYAWSALQRVPVLRHGVQVAGPRTVVRRQDRRAAGRLALATSRLAGGRVPAALWWSELHTGTQSVHVLPPPPRRPWRVRTVTRADSVPLSCAVMSLPRGRSTISPTAMTNRGRSMKSCMLSVVQVSESSDGQSIVRMACNQVPGCRLTEANVE